MNVIDAPRSRFTFRAFEPDPVHKGTIIKSGFRAAQQYGVDSAAAALLISYPGLIHAELGIPEDVSIIMRVALAYRDRQHPARSVLKPQTAKKLYV